MQQWIKKHSLDQRAKVCGDAQVKDNARVYGEAEVCGSAKVEGDAKVYGKAHVSGRRGFIKWKSVRGCKGERRRGEGKSECV